MLTSAQNTNPFFSSIGKVSDPTSYKEASKDGHLVKAMEEELSALQSNDTWTITSLPKHKKPIGCTWVNKTKFNSDGSINRHKAHLVAKGFSQVEGIDFTETFAPVSKMTTLCTIIAIGISKDWHMHLMNMQNAFLHGNLDEKVYMRIPSDLLYLHVHHPIQCVG